MYREHFRLKANPFHMTPDLNYLFLSTKHKGALACMEYGFMGGMGVVLLTGDIGTGKTTLLRLFLRKLPENVRFATIYNTNVSPEQFLSLFVQEFGFDAQNANKAQMVRTIETGLHKLRADGIFPVLVVDDAQNLSMQTLEEIRWLSNLQSEDRNLVQIVLVGQPELRRTLLKPPMASLAQRIGVNYHLKPFTRQEAQDYIQHRLKTAQGNPDLFTDTAVDLIYRTARGIPRTINLLCDNALIYAFSDDLMMVDAPIVEQVLAEMHSEELWTFPSFHSTDISSGSLPVNGETAAQHDDLNGVKIDHSYQNIEKLLGTLEELTDSYMKELRSLIKLLLKKEQERYGRLSEEFYRLKSVFESMPKEDRNHPKNVLPEQRTKDAPVANDDKNRAVVRLPDPSNKKGRG